jgi:hypothetical protein
MALMDFNKIKKLPPEKRIDALKDLREELNKLIEERKKEIDEAVELLKESEEELQVLLNVQTPESKKLSVEEIWGGENKETKKQKELEDITRDADDRRRKEFNKEEYINSLKQKQIDDIYDRVKSLYSDIKDTGVITAEQQDRLNTIRTALYEKEKDIASGQYDADRDSRRELNKLEKGIAGILGISGAYRSSD